MIKGCDKIAPKLIFEESLNMNKILSVSFNWEEQALLCLFPTFSQTYKLIFLMASIGSWTQQKHSIESIWKC